MSQRADKNPAPEQGRAMNVVVVGGQLRADPLPWTTRAGEELWSFDLSLGTGATREVVPVTWADDRAAALAAGDDVVVRGRVRKRFLGGAGAARPRTDVLAEAVVLARRSRQVERLLATAEAQLTFG
jgi:hypothetical protein